MKQPEIGEKTREGLSMICCVKVVGVGTVLIFLWKEGKIEPNQSIKAYLPEADYPDITVRQLLTHATDLGSSLSLIGSTLSRPT